MRLEEYIGWSELIFTPFSGTVLAARDRQPERKRLHLLRDHIVVLKNALTLEPNKVQNLRPILGNYIILKMSEKEIFTFFAHARTGSIQVRVGDEVHQGQRLAEIGHSGKTTVAHEQKRGSDQFPLPMPAGREQLDRCGRSAGCRATVGSGPGLNRKPPAVQTAIYFRLKHPYRRSSRRGASAMVK